MVEIDYVLARKLFQIGATIIFVFQAKESIRFETGLWRELYLYHHICSWNSYAAWLSLLLNI